MTHANRPDVYAYALAHVYMFVCMCVCVYVGDIPLEIHTLMMRAIISASVSVNPLSGIVATI